MRPLNSHLDAKREQLKADVDAWLSKGNRIPLIPIQFRDDDPLAKTRTNRQATQKQPGIMTREMVGKALLLNKEGWTRSNIAKKLGVSRETVTRTLISAGVVTRAV